jgi:adenosine deaminase
MFSSPLAGEYEIARTLFGMDDPALAAIALAGVRASFLDDDSKRRLEADIEAWLAAPGSGNGTPS